MAITVGFDDAVYLNIGAKMPFDFIKIVYNVVEVYFEYLKIDYPLNYERLISLLKYYQKNPMPYIKKYCTGRRNTLLSPYFDYSLINLLS